MGDLIKGIASIVQYDQVVFADNEGYDEFESIMYPDREPAYLPFPSGHDDAVRHLAQWDNGEYVEDPVFDLYESIGRFDYTYWPELTPYVLAWNTAYGYASLHLITECVSEAEFRAFVNGYVSAMLWANTMRYNDDMGETESFDAYYAGHRIDDGTRYGSELAYRELVDDCEQFVKANWRTLREVATKHFKSKYDPHEWEQHGHDYALTRNGHGAGYWDRGYGVLGDELSEAAKLDGPQNLFYEDGTFFVE